MAKNDPAPGSVAAAHPDDFANAPEAEFLRAVTMADGQSIDGYYLGYDWALLDDGAKKRHRFLLTNPIKGESPYALVWQAMMLDALLSEATLGKRTLVERLRTEPIPGPGKRTQAIYRVRQLAATCDKTALLGRPAKGE